MPKKISLSPQKRQGNPDYLRLIEFLVQPLLESPNTLSVDCEQANNNQRVWIRLAFEEKDKGRIFGRGGRNIQAIKAILTMAAMAAGQSVYLDVYGTHEYQQNQDHGFNGKHGRKRRPSRRSNTPKISLNPHSQ